MTEEQRADQRDVSGKSDEIRKRRQKILTAIEQAGSNGLPAAKIADTTGYRVMVIRSDLKILIFKGLVRPFSSGPIRYRSCAEEAAEPEQPQAPAPALKPPHQVGPRGSAFQPAFEPQNSSHLPLHKRRKARRESAVRPRHLQLIKVALIASGEEGLAIEGLHAITGIPIVDIARYMEELTRAQDARYQQCRDGSFRLT